MNGVKFVIPYLTGKTRPPIEALYPAFQRCVHFRRYSTMKTGPMVFVGNTRISQATHCLCQCESCQCESSHLIGHWLKSIMCSAGVDTSIFST